MPKILIAEDDPDIAALEKDYLEVEGFVVTITPDGRAALKLARTGAFDLIILDVMLPELNGFEICKRLRAESDIPIIIVTARGDSIDVIRGLGLGSDDYIAKPFDPAVLVARVKACLSSYQRRQAPTEKLLVGDLTILPQSFQVFRHGHELILTRKEFDLLYFLASHPNVVYSKENLFEHVWGLDSLADTATVAVHINRLRDKLAADSDGTVSIKTVWGAGYCLKIANHTSKHSRPHPC